VLQQGIVKIAHGDELATGRYAISIDAISNYYQTAAAKEKRSQAMASEAALKK